VYESKITIIVKVPRHSLVVKIRRMGYFFLCITSSKSNMGLQQRKCTLVKKTFVIRKVMFSQSVKIVMLRAKTIFLLPAYCLFLLEIEKHFILCMHELSQN